MRSQTAKNATGVIGVPTVAGGVAAGALSGAASAHADAVAYLASVAVRPGYHFTDAGAALAYGQGICAKVEQGRAYRQIMHDAKADFDTTDEYQASYVIAQAVNELCPALIWQLRNSGAHYRPPGR